MKKIILIVAVLFVMFFCQNLKAQVLSTKAEIIEKNGKNYSIEEVKEDVKNKEQFSVLKYEQEIESSKGDKIIRIKKFTFFNTGDKDICISFSFEEPLSEINSWVKYMRTKDYVRQGELEWKNYENSVVYSISREGDSCILRGYLDKE